MAVLGPYACVNMNGHNNIHSQLTKSLERILEDAYLSGELKLSGRKLREFPKPVKYDLSDTVIADLSKNRFSEVPEEVATCAYLEKLLLSQNVIRSVPDCVGALQSLTYLDLSSNQLTELPREICQMPLQVLLVSDNILTTLPKEIGRMTSLAELDAANNRLTMVPMSLGDCSGLRALDFSNNLLGLLPLQITYLRLEHLDVSCNCISSLPLELRNMSTLVTLNLDNNPLVSPPTTVCMRGRVHIFKYLENMANKDNQPIHKRVEETRRTTKHNSFNNPHQGNYQITSGNATIDCLRHKPRHVVDSGYCTDGVEKRWSNEGGGEAGGGSGRSTPSTPSTLSPGTALSRAHSLSSESPLAPMTPQLSGFRISPDGNMSNGDDKSKLAHQQTYRQYKEALRQQRQQDVYRPRTEHSSPETDSNSPASPHHPASPHLPASPLHSNVYNSSPTHTPTSPLLHSTPRRFQNGNPDKTEENKRPVQKVVPSRNVNKIYTNGNVDYKNGTDTYIKPTSPTKETNTLGYRSIPRHNGDAKLLTTSMTYSKGGPKTNKMPWNKDVAADKLSFTMKREFDKQKEESDLLQQLRVIIESRLKMSLPEPLAPALCDGVVLCHLANQVRPRAVGSVHVPSPAQPKLTMARCRRNVDNFLDACRRIGVEEELICSAEDILEQRLVPSARTVAALAHATPPHSQNDIENPNTYPQTYQEHYETERHAEPQRFPNSQYQETQKFQEDHEHETNTSEYGSDVTETSINYYTRSRYEEKYVSNFNEYVNYTIDETEEYYDNNNIEPTQVNYSPIYTNEGVKNRRSGYRNKVQFVTPLCKDNNILKSDHFEIYDTDEVDHPMIHNVGEQNAERYDRRKMNLDIQNNLNSELKETIETEFTDSINIEEERFKITCLCLGAFFLSAILLFMFPL